MGRSCNLMETLGTQKNFPLLRLTPDMMEKFLKIVGKNSIMVSQNKIEKCEHKPKLLTKLCKLLLSKM